MESGETTYQSDDYISSDDLSLVDKTNAPGISCTSAESKFHSLENIVPVTEERRSRVQLQEKKSDIVSNVEDLHWNTPLENSQSRNDSPHCQVPTGAKCPENELICASSLCFEAKKKTSLPIDATQGNISTPSSSESSVSGSGCDECMYVVSKLRDLPKLHRTVWRGDLIKIKCICNGIRKSVLNARDKEYRTALHLACAKGAKDIVSYLCCHLKSIIDVNLTDLNGCTPIHKLIDNGHGYNGSLDCLLDCGGNVNLANNFGHTPLHLAARHGDAVTTSYLIFKGASVHAMDQMGKTALHLAAESGCEEVITNLIMYGADIRSKDKMGRTPVEVATGKLARFMRDLVSDKENRNDVLLTEADYIIPSPPAQEITSLFPISKDEARARILNEWNANYLASDSDDDDDDDICEEVTEGQSNYDTNGSKYGSPQKESSFLTACWGNLTDKSGTISNESETTLEARQQSSCGEYEGCDSEGKINDSYGSWTGLNKSEETWEGENSLFIMNNKDTRSSSSRGSLEKYYSVASVFNCEHFKSMDTSSSLKKSYTLDELSDSSRFDDSPDDIAVVSSRDSGTTDHSIGDKKRTPLLHFSGADYSASNSTSLSFCSVVNDTDKCSLADARSTGNTTLLSSSYSAADNRSYYSTGNSSEKSTFSFNSSAVADSPFPYCLTITNTEDPEIFSVTNASSTEKCSSASYCSTQSSNERSISFSSNTEDSTSQSYCSAANSAARSSDATANKTANSAKKSMVFPSDVKFDRPVHTPSTKQFDMIIQDHRVHNTGKSNSAGVLPQTRQRIQKKMKQISACEIMSHTNQLTPKHKVIGDYDKHCCQKLEGQKQHDAVSKLRQELTSSQKMNASQESTIRMLQHRLKKKQDESVSQKEKQDEVLGELKGKLDQSQCDNKALHHQLETAVEAKQILLHKLEDSVKDKEELVEELENAYGSNQKLLLTVNDVDKSKEHMLQVIKNAKLTVRELCLKLKEANKAKHTLQIELENAVSAQTTNYELLQRLKGAKPEEINGALSELKQPLECDNEYQQLLQRIKDVENEKEQGLHQLQEVTIAKGKLQLEVVYVMNAYEEITKKLDDSNIAKKKLIQEVGDLTNTKRELLKEVETGRCIAEELQQKLADAASINDELMKEIEDSATGKMELIQDIEDARSEIEELKQRVNQTIASKEDLLEEIEAAAVAKMEMFQELENERSASGELEQLLRNSHDTKEQLRRELKEAKHANEDAKKQLSVSIVTKEVLLQKLKDATVEIAKKEMLLREGIAHRGERKSQQAPSEWPPQEIHHTKKGKSEVAQLSERLEAVNDELMVLVEQQESDCSILKEEWSQEKSELSASISQLEVSLERELKLKEEALEENHQLRLSIKEFVEALEQKNRKLEEVKTELKEKSESVKSANKQASHARFLESKVAITELALKSAQYMARAHGAQADAFQQRSFKSEESLRKLENQANEKEEEMKRMERSVNELEEMLRICKRRISEQNANNARLHDEVEFLQQKFHTKKAPHLKEVTGCDICSIKIKSLEHTVAVMKREADSTKKACGLLEENNKYNKAEISRLHTEVFKLQATVDEAATTRHEEEKDAMETRKIMEEQLRYKDEIIAAYMKKVKKMKQQQNPSVCSEDNS